MKTTMVAIIAFDDELSMAEIAASTLEIQSELDLIKWKLSDIESW